jgi:hypothetical protein
VTDALAPTIPRSKAILAAGLSRTPWTRVTRALERRVPVLRVFNYHGTPARLAENFERQLDHILSRYRGCSAHDLEPHLSAKASAPAALFTFDDGLANNFEVRRPPWSGAGCGDLLHSCGFSVRAARVTTTWFLEHVRPRKNAEHWHDPDLMAMSWIRCASSQTVATGCAPTPAATVRSTGTTDTRTLEEEIVGSRAALERELPGVTIDGFCWPVDFDHVATAADSLVRHTYRYALCGGSRPLRTGHDLFRLFRTNVEVTWPIEVVDLQLSGILDIKFWLTTTFGTYSG